MQSEAEKSIDRAVHQFISWLFSGGFVVADVIISLVIFILTIIAWVNIFKKAGYAGCLGCLMFVPCLNTIMLFWLGFTRWPTQADDE